MNTRFKDVFRGKVVNKRLTVNTGVDEFPRFVVEYLIDNYCTEENFHEDLQQVIKRLRENFVHGAEAEKIRHQIRETRNHSIIANLEVRLQETEDKYWGTIGAINESFVNVTESLVRQYPMLLSGGMWGTITLTYDETEVHNKKIRPFKVTEFTPFQISVIDLNEYIEKRKQFEADEWLDFLINSIGLEPGTVEPAREAALPVAARADGRSQLQHHRAGPQGNRQDVPLPQPELLHDRSLWRKGDPG